MDFYLTDLNSEIEIANAVYSGNMILDLILAQKINEARKLNIQLEHLIDIPNELPVKDIDFVSLITNILDNAFEASMKLPASKKRQIRIVVKQQKHFLAIHCKNPCIAKPLEITNSFVDHSKRRGFGLLIIQRIAEKHHGFMQIHHENEEYNLSVYLSLNSQPDSI